MQVLHISISDDRGGAARAAYRIHCALKEDGVDSKMLVLFKETHDESVVKVGCQGRMTRLTARLRKYVTRRVLRKWKTLNKELHSLGFDSLGMVDRINSSSADIVHLHWVNGMLSIADIARIRKPLVWTMHDMWPFCGAEHYAEENEHSRYRVGYTKANRPSPEKGPDLSKVSWEAKMKHWKNVKFNIVPTTRWLEKCVSESLLFRGVNQRRIPYPVFQRYPWRAVDRSVARSVLGLPADKILILTGADGGIRNPRKGGDLLVRAFRNMLAQGKLNAELMIFGQGNGQLPDLPVHWMGTISDDRLLAMVYAAADVMVVPSRQEAFGQTATEALACGTPVVAFRVGGLKDIVEHRINGWLAEPFREDSLAEGIEWVVRHLPKDANAGDPYKEFLNSRFQPARIAMQYMDFYNAILTGDHKR